MSLQKFNSVGSAMTPTPSSSSSSPSSLKHKSSTRIPRLSHNMVSLRYEDAVQAQPPIMVASAKRTKSNSSASSAASSISNISTESAASISTRSSTDSNHYTSRIGRSRSSRSVAPSYSAFPAPPSPSASSSRLSSATTVTSVSACSDSPLPSPISIPVSTRGSRIPRSPTLGSSMPVSPTSSFSPASPASPTTPTTPTSPRYPLVIPRAAGLAAPPVEQHPALRGSAAPAFRPIVEETSEITESASTAVRSPSSSSAGRTAQRAAGRAAKRATISVMPSALPAPIAISRAPMAKRDSGLGSPSGSVLFLGENSASPKSPKVQRTASYKRPSVSHMKQMIPLKTVEKNLPQVLPAPSGPPPQRPPPPVPTRASTPSKKQPASQIAAASPFPPAPIADAAEAMKIDEPVDQPMGMPSIIPMSAFSPAPAAVTTKTDKAEKEKSWRLPKALTFRSRKKTAGTGAPSVISRPASFLPASTAFDHSQTSPIGSIGHNSPSVPLPCAVEPNQPTRPNASWPPILAPPLSHLPSGEHAPALNTSATTSAPTTTSSSSRPFSSSPFTFSLSSASTAVPATPSSRPSSRRSNRPASRLSTHVSSLSLSPKQKEHSTQQQIQKDHSPPSSHFFFRVLSMSDPCKNGKAKAEADSNIDDSPLINTAIPTESLIEDDLFESLTFSKRGSLMFGGQRAADVASAMSSMDKTESTRLERESFQVRSLYMDARGLNWEDGRPPSIAVASPASASPSAVSTNPTNPTNENTNPTLTTATATATANPPSTLDLASLSIADPDPARLSIVSATSIATASTGIALSGTESSLSLVTPQPTTNPVSPVSPRQPVTPSASTSTAAAASSTPSIPSQKEAYELAGGIEDWEDVDVADVDRYGFIRAKPRPLTSASSVSSLATAGGNDEDDGNAPTRASTGLSSGLGRHFSRRPPSRKNTRNTARSMYTSRSTSTTATAAAAARSSLRAAANQLPHNKDRKWIDEAGDMLTMEPGLGDIAEDEDAERLAELVKRKEWERAEKWRRMAKVIARGTADGDAPSSSAPVPDGSGMDFEFDLGHPKLVERTWKGIPDRWRAPAWYSFLASSAAHRRAQRLPPVPPLPSAKDKEAESASESKLKPDGGETEEQIIAAFSRLQETASPDDVQIDLDVPRTVNGHVMFRKRYRGGQRLLFRVLHALSLYFADTGYVQGMAALAATLLCYYDEERCFVMLVRLFHLRGLERLYEPGFGGLMEALGEFEQKWLARNSPRIAQKLSLLNIDPTTYATRWYLTLFNLSVPFAAQLRIWDVFMLLGDGEMEVGPLAASASPSSSILKRPSTARPATARPATARPATADPKAAKSAKSAKNTEHLSATALITASAPKPVASKANLAILHATSTALIDGLQEVLQDADFENAMKAVTSWVPIKDENLLMKVVHAEWKRHQRMK